MIEPEPVKVAIVAPEAMPVIVQNPAAVSGTPRQDQAIDPSRPASTTFQQDLTTAGQRDINRIWETTQGKIALYVIVGAMAINAAVLVLSIVTARDMTAAQALALGFVNSLATGVTSFYFSRTNHAAIGGMGNKPQEQYVGR